MKVTNTTKHENHPEWILGGDPKSIEQQESRGQQQLIESTLLPIKVGGYLNKSSREIYESMGIQVKGEVLDDPLFLEVVLPEGWRKEKTEHSMWNKLVDDKGRTRATFFYKAAYYDRDAFICFETRFSISAINYLPQEEKGEFVTKIVKVRNPRLAEMQGREVVTQRMSKDRIVYFEDFGERGRGLDIIFSMDAFIEEEQRVWVSKYKDYYSETNATPHYVEVKDSDKVIFTTQNEPDFFTRKYRKDRHMQWHNAYDAFKAKIYSKAVKFLDTNYPNWKDVNAYWN